MKTIIAGSRTVEDYDIVCEAIQASGFEISEIISGAAKGVDRLGERFAEENDLPVEKAVPDWKRFGRGAGAKRNADMAAKADALIAIWDGESRGTAHIVRVALKAGLRVFVYDGKRREEVPAFIVE